MYYTTFAIVMILSFFICYQDFSYRAVSWILLLLLLVTGIFFSLSQSDGILLILKNVFINLSFLLFQFLLLKVFFVFRNPKDHTIVNRKLGIGDILFLVSTCCFFSPVNFIIYYISSLIFSIIFYLLLLQKNKPGNQPLTIPLAGLQAAFLILALAFCKLYFINPESDSWILVKLIPV
jgi:hypothetical protein